MAVGMEPYLLFPLQLDVYHPQKLQTCKTPILFWIYGGGFVTGARVLDPPFDVVYTNIGGFFAQQGFITVIPDYRLAVEPWLAQYPKPVEDIRDAISWIVLHKEELTTPTTPCPDIDSIFVFGHSAGATHAGTLIFEPSVIPTDSLLRTRIKGVILAAGLYHNNPESSFEDELRLYYGDKLESHTVKELVRSVKSKNFITLPKVFLMEAENEPKVFKTIRQDFQDELEAMLQTSVPFYEAKDHNHISVPWCLGSGQGEEWGFEISNWIRGVL